MTLAVAFLPRLRIGIPVAIALLILFNFLVAPAYMKWAHSSGVRKHLYPDAIEELNRLDDALLDRAIQQYKNETSSGKAQPFDGER
jgi:hypothetical protein